MTFGAQWSENAAIFAWKLMADGFTSITLCLCGYRLAQNSADVTTRIISNSTKSSQAASHGRSASSSGASIIGSIGGDLDGGVSWLAKRLSILRLRSSARG